MIREIVTAIENAKCLELSYGGFKRLVEVHSYGVTSEGNDVIRVWQVSGGSVSNERTGWKLLRIDEARSINLTDIKSEAPRHGYKRDDKGMTRIYCQI